MNLTQAIAALIITGISLTTASPTPSQQESTALEKRAGDDYYAQGLALRLNLALGGYLLFQWLYDSENGRLYNNGYDGSQIFQAELNPADYGGQWLTMRSATVYNDDHTGRAFQPIENANFAGLDPGVITTPGGEHRIEPGTTVEPYDQPFEITDRVTGARVVVASRQLEITEVVHQNSQNPPAPPQDEL